MTKEQLSQTVETAKTSTKKSWRWFNELVVRRPFVSFLVALSLLFGLIILSNVVAGAPDVVSETEPVRKTVATYKIGTAPMIQSQAQVKKTGLVSIFAQTSGVVQKVYKKEGDAVSRGTQLAWISTNYTGGTISSVTRQQAQTSYQFTKDNLEANKNLISQQRQIAQANRDNTEQLRVITEKSLQETSDLIGLNNEIVGRVNEDIKKLQLIVAPTDAEKTQLTQLLSQKAQLQSVLNQLNAGLRANQYQTSRDNPPTKLADGGYNVTTQQLDLQEKSLDLQEKLGQLSLRSAQIGESLNFPSAPYKGKVERMAVVPGQLVSPGELLAVVKAATTSATLEVSVPREIALQIAPAEYATVRIGDQTISLLPTFISSQPTNGSMFLLKFQLPDAVVDQVNANAFLTIDLPVGMPSLESGTPYVPLDAIFQTQDGAYVYVAQESDGQLVARARQVVLGEVIGNYVAVESGVTAGDQIIIDRTVLEEDLLTIK